MRIDMGWAFRVLFLPLCLGLAFLCVWGVTYLPSEKSAAILGCSAAGAVIAATCGWKIGRLLEFRVKRGAPLRIPVVLLGLPLPVLPCYLCTHIRDRVPRSLYLLEGMAVVLLIAAAVAAAYLLGFVFLPGRAGISTNRRFRLIIFLYGCLLAGVLTGYLRYPRDRLTVPQSPRSGGNADEEPDRKTLEDLVSPVTELNGEGGEITIEIHDPWPQIPGRFLPSPSSTIRAEGGTAVIDGHPLRLVDHLLRPVRQLIVGGGEAIQTSVEKGFASNLEETALPAFVPEPPIIYPTATPPLLDLLLQWPEDLEILPIGTRVVLLPWSQPVPPGDHHFSAGRDDRGERFLVAGAGYSCLIPGPVEFSIDAWHGATRTHTLPSREGATVRTSHNVVRFVKMYPGRFSLIHRNIGRPALEAVEGSEPVTTALFCAALQPGRSGIRRIDAVGREGQTWTGDCRPWRNGVGVVTFECAPGDIGGFRVVEWKRLSRIIYQIPQLKGLPPENAGCENLLDLRIPESFLRPPWFDDLVATAVMDWRWSSEVHRVYQDGFPDGITVRQLLDYVYGEGWSTEDNRLVRHHQVWKGGPAIRKIVTAAQTIRK